MEEISQPTSEIDHSFVSLYVNIVVFQRPPKSLNEHVIERTSATVHADLDVRFFKDRRERMTRKLCPLVCVEDRGSSTL